jgi:uncharacterized protein
MNHQKVQTIALLLAMGWALLCLPLTWWDWQGRWHTAGHEASYLLKTFVFWLQFSLVPLLVCVALPLWGMAWGWRKIGRTMLAVCLALIVWGGQVEPNLLLTRHTTVAAKGAAGSAKPVKIAVVADIHWGLFVRDWQLQRLVNHLNSLDVDAIMVAGDWTYEPKLDLVAGFAPLAQLKAPVFAVLGNHDVERPGPKLSSALRGALSQHGVQWLEGKTILWQGWQLSGLDDLWGGRPQPQIAALAQKPAKNRIILTHQPDTAALLPPDTAQLTVAGHTHGGQVVLPLITAALLQSTMRQPWYDGLYQSRFGQVFVSTGTGMVGLPIRFAMPPRVDVLHITQVP